MMERAVSTTFYCFGVVADIELTETKELGTYVMWHNCRKIVFVDTPGFNDPALGDDVILKQVAEYMVTITRVKQKLAAVIYVHSMTQERYSTVFRHNQEIFRNICGDEAMRAVSLVTTKWDRATTDPRDKGGNLEAFKKKEHQLRTNYWKAQTEAGAQLFRHGLNPEDSTKNLLDQILRTKGGISLLLQDQIVGQDKLLSETDPGKYLKVTYAHYRSKEAIQQKWDEVQSIDAEIEMAKIESLPWSNAAARREQAYKEWQRLHVKRAEDEQAYADRLDAWAFADMAMSGAALPAGIAGLGIGAIAGWGIAVEEGLAAGVGVGLFGGVLTAAAAGGVGLLVVGSIWAVQKIARDRRVYS
jgi:hypothetical protein